MGRARRRRRSGRSSGGALTSLRGGFRSVAQGVTGTKPARPASRARRLAGSLLTAVLFLLTAGLLLRRLGVLRR